MRAIVLLKITCGWVLPFLLVAGCAAPKGNFRTQKAEDYNGKLERVLVVYYPAETTSTLGRDFLDHVADGIAARLVARNVPAETLRLQRDALDRNAPIKAAAVRFRAKQLLACVITHVDFQGGAHRTTPESLPTFNSSLSTSLEFSLMDAQSGRTVWRTEAYFYAPPRPEDIADQMLGELMRTAVF